MHLHEDVDGFTLVETLVATVLVCTAVAGVAQLGVVAVTQNAAVQRDDARCRSARYSMCKSCGCLRRELQLTF